MRLRIVLTFATMVCLTVPAFAQDKPEMQEQPDLYNNQTSIVPGTVPDKVKRDPHELLKDRQSREAVRQELHSGNADPLKHPATSADPRRPLPTGQ